MNDYGVIVIRGDCFSWACIPSKTVMLPGEAVHGRRHRKQIRLSWKVYVI
jgi:pyruvate/2-oxoglutarate dehydrogenase complex dihydrolipoamide dehydrogenase (E3) component